MGCVIEMLPCDRCGREVERHNIYLLQNEEGTREFACPECAGESLLMFSPQVTKGETLFLRFVSPDLQPTGEVR